MVKTLLQSILCLLSFSILAQELLQVPINKQLSESNAIIMGEFQGSYTKKHSNGEVVTNVSFKLEKSLGLGSRELLNKNSFSFVYKGGVWQGIEYPNKNQPRFRVGEKYIVLLRKGQYDFYPLYDKLGVYKVLGRKGEELVVSQAFPSNDNFGSSSFRTFNLWVNSVFGEELKGISSDKHIYVTTKKQQRKIASLESEEANRNQYRIPIMWLVVLFGLLGAAHIRKTKA